MKKVLSIVLFVFLLFGGFNYVSAENTELTQEEAINILSIIQSKVNEGDTDFIISTISEDADKLIEEGIIKNIKGKKIKFIQEFKSIENLGGGKYKINARYSAEGLNWSASGLSNYYTVKIVDNKWMIVDTNFYQFMPEFMNFFGHILPFVMIFGFIFFIWMLNDCSKRKIENKWLWILLIIFVPLGSFIYFFTGRKKYPKLDKYLKKDEKKLQK